MPAKLTIRDPKNICRLCSSSLQPFELERQLCSVCNERTSQLGVRTEKDFEKALADILIEPAFRRVNQ
jgi:hypothetical protein